MTESMSCTPLLPDAGTAHRRAALGSIAQAVAISLDVGQVLPVVAVCAQQVLAYDRLLILAADGDPAVPAPVWLRVTYGHAAVTDAEPLQNQAWSEAHFSFGASLLAGQPIVVEDLATLPAAFPGDANVLKSGRALLMAPIFGSTHVLGGLVFASHMAGTYSPSDLPWAEVIASLLAVALEHQRLNRQTSELAAANERKRLAGEIHDALAQSLGGIIANLAALNLGEAALNDSDTLAWRTLKDARGALENARRVLERAGRHAPGLQPGAVEHLLHAAPAVEGFAAPLGPGKANGASARRSPSPKWMNTRIPGRPAPPARQDTNPDRLTVRELDVLWAMAVGLRYKDIGAQLDITTKTVEYHVTHIFQKLHVDSRSKAVAVALQRGMFDEAR